MNRTITLYECTIIPSIEIFRGDGIKKVLPIGSTLLFVGLYLLRWCVDDHNQRPLFSQDHLQHFGVGNYLIDENRNDLFFESPIYQHVAIDASHVLYFSHYMKPYFDLIQGMEHLLADCQLKEKYHHHFFLELYAVFKVLGLTCWKPILVERIMNRVQEEMISDLHHYLSKSTFETVNDIIYDELIGMPIFGGVQKLSEI